jgi:hypothetical protein
MLPLHLTLAALLHPPLRIYVPFSNAFHHSTATLDPISIQQPNSSNAQAAPSSLAVLVLSKLQQYRTERYSFLSPISYRHCSLISVQVLFVAPRPRTQQQSQSHFQSSSSQSQPTATLTSTTPAQGTNTTTAGATVQSPPISLFARVVLFVCCASPPHANGYRSSICTLILFFMSFATPSISFLRHDTGANSIILTVATEASFSFPRLES